MIFCSFFSLNPPNSPLLVQKVLQTFRYWCEQSSKLSAIGVKNPPNFPLLGLGKPYAARLTGGSIICSFIIMFLL